MRQPIRNDLVSRFVPVRRLSRTPDCMRIKYIPLTRGHIHPIQEIAAFMLAVQIDFTSRQKVAAEFGYDIAEIDHQKAV
ncbi:hypothetical protein [Rhizobium phaseoli]|uniref:hypothetical protein n=1 Tax=Rhizobium phaseoli TaxID=396 RepID=UPI0007E9DA4D|nr:hypothetical protein [Rhizobium phaseoli]